MTTVNDLLAAARARLDRPDPQRAAELVRKGAYLVDTSARRRASCRGRW
jgi:hypothetical protein